MSNIKLYFKKTEIRNDGMVALAAQFNHNGQQRVRIGETFPADKIKGGQLNPGKDILLNEIAKRVRAKFSLIELEIEKAKSLRIEILPYIKDKLLEYHGYTKKEIAEAKLTKESKADFIELYKEWIELSKSRISNQTNQKLSPNTIKTYNIVLGHLKELNKVYPLDVTKIDKSFYQTFNKYIIGKKELSANAFGKYIAIIKVFMKWAEETLEENKIEISTKYQRFKAPKKYMGVQHLRSFDLRRFQAFRTDKKHLEQANDLFLMMCYTGLSVSDLKTLSRKNIQIDRIVIRRGKTSNECIIPFFDDEIFKPVELFNKYNFHLPEMADQNINLHLKDIQKAIEFDKFSISTKIGRKTFATIKHLEQKVPSQIVMKATGHTTEKAFLRYIGTDHDAVIESFQDNSVKLKVG